MNVSLPGANFIDQRYLTPIQNPIRNVIVIPQKNVETSNL